MNEWVPKTWRSNLTRVIPLRVEISVLCLSYGPCIIQCKSFVSYLQITYSSLTGIESNASSSNGNRMFPSRVPEGVLFIYYRVTTTICTTLKYHYLYLKAKEDS